MKIRPVTTSSASARSVVWATYHADAAFAHSQRDRQRLTASACFPGCPRLRTRLDKALPTTIGLQPNSEDVALETLIEPWLLIATSQPRQVFRHIGGQFGH